MVQELPEIRETGGNTRIVPGVQIRIEHPLSQIGDLLLAWRGEPGQAREGADEALIRARYGGSGGDSAEHKSGYGCNEHCAT